MALMGICIAAYCAAANGDINAAIELAAQNYHSVQGKDARRIAELIHAYLCEYAWDEMRAIDDTIPEILFV